MNEPNTGHALVFIDGVFYALASNQAPIMFSGLQFGNHTIRIQLVNNDNSALSPDVSKSITVSVLDDPAMSLTEMIDRLAYLNDVLTSNTKSLYYIAVGNIILTIVVLIMVWLKK